MIIFQNTSQISEKHLAFSYWSVMKSVTQKWLNGRAVLAGSKELPGLSGTHLSQGLGLCVHMLFRSLRAGYSPLRWVSDSHWPSGVSSFFSPPSSWRVGWGAKWHLLVCAFHCICLWYLMALHRTPHRNTHSTLTTPSASHLPILCLFCPFPLFLFVPRRLHFHSLSICTYVVWCLCIKSKKNIVEKTHVCLRLTFFT